MWEIYDALIEEVPKELRVEECLIGLHWTLVRSRATGMALTPFERSYQRPPIDGIGRRIAGMPVRRLAEYVKSWDPFEATLGVAAINSVLNSVERIEALCGVPLSSQPKESAFMHYVEKVRGKRVAVIGRFPDLDELGKACRLTVLERNPGSEDLPDPACEFVLAEQDFVFMTATTLINKTLPRLLALSQNAETFLVGPSTPFSPALFEHGIHTLAGTVVADSKSVWQAVQEGATRNVFDFGAQMTKLSREDILHR